MRVFLDTNVVLDWLLDRTDTFAPEAAQIMEAAEKKDIEAYISPGSACTIAYVLEKSGIKGDQLKMTLLNIFNILKVKATDSMPFINACQNNFRDIEDAFQYQIALIGGKTDYFVTANIKDFTMVDASILPVVTPLQMVGYLG